MKYIALSVIVLFLMIGCGGGSSVGNGRITIQSTSYSNSAGLLDLYAAVNEFKFCITKIQLKNADGQNVQKDGASSIEAILGLVNASNAGTTTSWGDVTIPVGFTLQELTVEVHKDAENCSGADYSAIYNGTKLTRDLEFKFVFNPTVSVSAGDTLKLGLSAIATAFEQASQAGKLNNEQITEYLQSTTKGTGSK